MSHHVTSKQIVWIVPALDFGGVETLCTELAPVLVSRNVQITVINLGKAGRAARALAGHGISVYNLGGSVRPWALSTLYRVYRLLRVLRPSLVHCRVVEANWLGGITCVVLGIPFFVEEVGVPRRRSWMGNVLRRGLYARSARVISVSSATHDWLSERGFFSGSSGETRGITLPNPVDSAKYHRERGAPNDRSSASGKHDAVVIGTVCRLVEEKGIDVLLASLSSISTDQRAVEVRVVGDGPMREQLETQACSLKKKFGQRHMHSPRPFPRVVFCGYREDVPTQLKDLDIFVLPSRTEGVSLSLLEAMAAGVACVGTTVGDTPRLLAEERGICVAPDDPVALAKALNALSQDSNLRRSMASRAERYVRKHHSLETYSEKLLSLYETCAS
ncbi:MAG: glycosyltransferase family 4 protein [Candidatus Paceibacterota bacterium]